MASQHRAIMSAEGQDATGSCCVRHREELAMAVTAAQGAHQLVDQLHEALEKERSAVERLVTERDRIVDESSRHAGALTGEVARLEAELAALHRTRVFRYTAGLRAAYARSRGRR